MEKLRREVASQLETPIQRFDKRDEKTDRERHQFLDRHINISIRNFERTRSRIKMELFNKAVEILSSSGGRLHIAGSVSSHGLACYFYLSEESKLNHGTFSHVYFTRISIDFRIWGMKNRNHQDGLSQKSLNVQRIRGSL